MNRFQIVVSVFVLAIQVGHLNAQSFKAELQPLIQNSCAHCHDTDETEFNVETLGHDLANAKTFRKWEKAFDRIERGEMPPASEDRPDAGQLEIGLKALKRELSAASVARQAKIGRVPSRRLTKFELENTIRDLFLIDRDVTSGIPDEVESGSFDTVGATQRISAVHMESYLRAADETLDLAIRLDRQPYTYNEVNFERLEEWHEKPANQGGNVTRKLKSGDGIALFTDVDYLTYFSYHIEGAGIHRLTAKVEAFQSKTPVTAKFIVKEPSGAARLVKAIDLKPNEPQTVEVKTFLKPGDIPYLTVDLEVSNRFSGVFLVGSKTYKGRGLAIHSQTIEGPIFESWPPPSTRRIFDGLEFVKTSKSEKGPFRIETTKSIEEHVSSIVRQFAPLVFRRDVSADELDSFVELADSAIEEGRELKDVVRIPLRSMLSSPQFLLFNNQPGELNDFDLANRLSYFLWKSMPDEKLLKLARYGQLSKSETLKSQVNRMLDDEKSSRFVNDFVGQWLRLDHVNVTAPDDGLYPEFDELLGDSIPKETQLFFAEMVKQNLSMTNLIDSDFTILNRRLAKHYRIKDVEGQHFRKVDLPPGSPRGGVLTQAAILKTTANGTTTSPVTRGNFVLTNFLGTPPSPPPPDIGSVEPDTRGKTTIREILAAHRDMESCNTCHRKIDPPGFALESFDPIGGYRRFHRASGGERTFGGFTTKLPPKRGPKVDASGVTDDGKEFTGIEEFKQHLLEKKEQVARNFVSQLVVYSTGGEIQFADRDEIESILNQTRETDFLVRDIVHEVIQSKIFRYQ